MKLAFMLSVTAYLVARVFVEATSGAAVSFEMAVYALTAAFGLEFLATSWQSAGIPRKGGGVR
jgi:hypothetical protein